MPLNEQYARQVALLLRVLPLVAAESCFALKGGTAINLFIRDMPRLSVDIDLTYLPLGDRATSLAAIEDALKRIGETIRRTIPGAKIIESRTPPENRVIKLSIRADEVQIKIEVTPVTRGCVYPPEIRPVSPKVEAAYGYAEMQVVSFPDLYAGKIVAALDRQHPRDLFDVRDLLANEGIDDALRNAFIVYLLSHNRPFSEVLAPTRLDITHEFEHSFNGMTDTPVTIEELVQAREDLITAIMTGMPQEHRRFLLSVQGSKPDWSLLGVPGIETLPAVSWRLHHLAKLDPQKRIALQTRLREVLGVN